MAHFCGLLLLWWVLATLQGSVIGSSDATEMAKSPRGSDEGSIEGKAERDFLMGTDNPAIRKNKWKLWKWQWRGGLGYLSQGGQGLSWVQLWVQLWPVLGVLLSPEYTAGMAGEFLQSVLQLGALSLSLSAFYFSDAVKMQSKSLGGSGEESTDG